MLLVVFGLWWLNNVVKYNVGCVLCIVFVAVLVALYFCDGVFCVCVLVVCLWLRLWWLRLWSCSVL